MLGVGVWAPVCLCVYACMRMFACARVCVCVSVCVTRVHTEVQSQHVPASPFCPGHEGIHVCPTPLAADDAVTS